MGKRVANAEDANDIIEISGGDYAMTFTRGRLANFAAPRVGDPVPGS
jgi:hypothetical protein